MTAVCPVKTTSFGAMISSWFMLSLLVGDRSDCGDGLRGRRYLGSPLPPGPSSPKKESKKARLRSQGLGGRSAQLGLAVGPVVLVPPPLLAVLVSLASLGLHKPRRLSM